MGLFGDIWKGAKKLGSTAADIGSTVLPVNLKNPLELAKVAANPMYAFHRSGLSKAGARAAAATGIPLISDAAAAHMRAQGMLEAFGHRRVNPKDALELARMAQQHGGGRIPQVPRPPPGAVPVQATRMAQRSFTPVQRSNPYRSMVYRPPMGAMGRASATPVLSPRQQNAVMAAHASAGRYSQYRRSR